MSSVCISKNNPGAADQKKVGANLVFASLRLEQSQPFFRASGVCPPPPAAPLDASRASIAIRHSGLDPESSQLASMEPQNESAV